MTEKKHHWQIKAKALIKSRYGNEEAYAAAIGKSQSWVNHKLSGRRNSPLADIEIIASGFDMTATQLITDPDEYILIKKDPTGTKERTINEIREVAAEYIIQGKEKELQEIIDLSTGRLERIKNQKED